MRILAISGSLRAVSLNTTLLHAARLLAPADVEVLLYDGLDALPHFNPDREGPNAAEPEPPPVVDFRAQLQASDGVLISSPEYAHGVPGALKDALDWIVGSGELVGKPVGLFNASAYATHAHAFLTEILTTMDARVIREACVTVPLLGKTLDAAGVASDPELSGTLRAALAALISGIKSP